ncbi:MAG: glycosyltransferase [Candidatus Aenigmatarchaeota archaeon]
MGNEIIKVYSLFGKHPIYESIIKYPPKGIYFIHAPSAKEFERLSIYTPSRMEIKNFVLNLIYSIKIPRIFFVPVSGYDLIHSSRGFLILNKKRWVVDFEHIGSFGAFSSERVKRISLKFLGSKYCKKILPHSIAAMNSFLNGWNINEQTILQKLEVLYPAIKARKIRRRKKQEVKIGFLATRGAFYEKGGRELLEAFKILNKKYDNISLIMKVKPPPEVLKFSQTNVSFVASHFNTREELFRKFYEELDIFVLPTYVDSFGFSLLEAMSCGIPIIATNIFAIPEIVEDGKNGFLISSPISDFRKNFVPNFFDRDWLKMHPINLVINQLVEKLSLLIEDSSLRRKMGRYGRRLVEKGKFSIKERNKKLKKIYEEALRF